MTPKELLSFLNSEGYTSLSLIEGRGICGIYRFMFTTGLVTGLDQDGYAGRYCYNTKHEAEVALSEWDGAGDPPGDWIKYKGKGGERSRIKA